ncbi:hypothetical protein E2C01_025904 [Portunus trituberculatus]|uniref:Uncharacterized protein n=1 Tax=Portunus trituberculatus TaxID=210409 RepID=A0A5B7EGR6_PORTR|nr:hypothetical protein [Portunus trituberculatus]
MINDCVVQRVVMPRVVVGTTQAASATPRGLLSLRGRRNRRLQDNALPSPTEVSPPVTKLGLGSDPPMAFPEVTVYDLGRQAGLGLAILRSLNPFLQGLGLRSCPSLAIHEVYHRDLGGEVTVADLRNQGGHGVAGVCMSSIWGQDELGFGSLGGQAGELLSFPLFLLILLWWLWLVQEPPAVIHGDCCIISLACLEAEEDLLRDVTT